MLAFSHLMPTIDSWGQDITETLGGPSFIFKRRITHSFCASQTSPSLSLSISHHPLKKLMTAPRQAFQILSRIPQRTSTSPLDRNKKILNSSPHIMSTLLSIKALSGLKPKHSWRQRIMTSLQVFKHNPSNRTLLSLLFANLH